MSLRRILGTAVLLTAIAPPVPAAAQPVDLLDPASISEAARKKPKPPGGFPVLPGIYKLHGSAPGLPQDDLEPLRAIVGKASFVALGESIHTSGGYYEMKFRTFRFLVEKMGFRAFAIENNWESADRINQYVQTCQGSADEAVRNLYYVWQSAETREMIQWMCDWNRSHRKKKDKIHFFGFDVQQPGPDGSALTAFLERIGIGGGDPRVVDMRRCDGVAAPTVYPNPIPDPQHQQCLQGLAAVQKLFDEEGKRIAAETSPQDFEYAKLRLLGLKSWQGQIYNFGKREFEASSTSRDSGMAQAFRTLRAQRYPKLKVALWAHNFHIARNAERSAWRMNTMGYFLRQTFGSDYVTVGLISNVTEIDWPQTRGCGRTNEARHERTVERLLNELGHEYLLVNLGFPGGNPPFLVPGQAYRLSESNMVPASQFDAVIFLSRSRKMDPLAWPPCQ